jgi:acetylornithine deacetylase/succinyl-diaminopimelate desuccinylase-like protein
LAVERLGDKVNSLMPELRSDLEDLVRIPSVSGAGRPEQPIIEAYKLVERLFADAGLQNARALDLPDTSPILIGEIPAPAGAPTVLLYSHYDVVPAGDDAKWDSPPFAATERDGAVFGRGTADTKSNILAHVGALRAWEGKPPVGIKVVIEGMEEIGSAFTTYPPSDPELFACDAMVIADMGSVRPGVPTLTVALRGTAQVIVEVQTLVGPKHSGQFGGAAPDALVALLHALCTLHDPNGDVAVKGLRRESWTGEAYSEQEFRELAEVLPGRPLIGTGDLGSRVWSGPAITVTGIDVPDVDHALNAVAARSRALLNVRVHPEQDAREAQEAVVRHLESQRPFGIELKASPEMIGNGFAAKTTGPAYDAARRAWAAAYGRDTVQAAGGGSIPLVNALAEAAPQAEILLVGTCDGYANIHAPNERVLLDEFERATAAEAEFFELFARARE